MRGPEVTPLPRSAVRACRTSFASALVAAAVTVAAACTPAPEQACPALVRRAWACDKDLSLPPDPAPITVEGCVALPALERARWHKDVDDRCARAGPARLADPVRVTNCGNLALKHINCRATRYSREETRELMRRQALDCLSASIDEVQVMWADAEATCVEQKRALAAQDIDLEALRALVPNPEEKQDLP